MSARVDATDVECPACGAWVGWACEGDDYGYHGAGYHSSRQHAADQAAATKEIDMSTKTQAVIEPVKEGL